MLITQFAPDASAEFRIARTDTGVSMEFSYDLTGPEDPDDESWTWEGSIDSELGDDHAGTTQTSEQGMTLGYDATLKHGVTEVGSYEINDGGEDGETVTVDFDVTVFSTAGTYVGEGTMSHFVLGSDEADDFTGGDGGDVLGGYLGDDTLDGGKGDDRIYGGEGDDSVSGGEGLDTVRGGLGDDDVDGGDGDDKIVGGEGADVLTGGAGADTFVFKDILGEGDTITDFVSGEDRIRLDRDVFTALERGALGEGVFVTNETGDATEAAQRLIYDTVTGELYYDADGSGDGEAILVATFGPDVDLTADDILAFGGAADDASLLGV